MGSHMCPHLLVEEGGRHLQLMMSSQHSLPCFGESVFPCLRAHRLNHALLSSKLKGSICLSLLSAGMTNAYHTTVVCFKDKVGGEGLQAL